MKNNPYVKMARYWLERLKLMRLKRDPFRSQPLRQYFAEKHDIHVGLYSYGCFDANRIGRKTTIGRYCSFANTACCFNVDHPTDFISTHPLFYSDRMGAFGRNINNDLHLTPCVIEDDVWVGHNAVILPSVTHIGRGAIIAAGAVVHKNVAPYTIVAGVPAKTIRQRFDEVTIQRIENSRWWEKDEAALVDMIRQNPDLIYNPSGQADVSSLKEAVEQALLQAA